MTNTQPADFRTDLRYADSARQLLVSKLYPRIAMRFVSLGGSRGSQWLQQHAHIDAVLELFNGRSVTVEEKIIRREYQALTIETFSSVERQTPGWITVSTADWLLYCFRTSDPLGLHCYQIDMQALRRWFMPVQERYRVSDTINRAYNGIYRTRCRIVPLSDIAQAVGYREYWPTDAEGGR